MIETISDRQLEIIEAAGKILTASGVSGLTIKNLAKEMKFSESAIYRHFTSKEEIIIALLEYLAISMDERYTMQFPACNHQKKNLQRYFKINFHSLKRTLTL
jgi:TetR/AcrR family fatty acid metabolism transcriptional regulator